VTQPAETAPRALTALQQVIAANAADEIHLTDRGNGRRFAELYRDVVRYVVDQDEWLVRHEPHWAPDPSRLTIFGLTAGVIRGIRAEALLPGGGDDEDARRERMLGYANSAESEGARWRMVSCAREHPELIVEENDLDANLNLLATPSGVVDLLTGEARDAEPDDMCTRVTRVEYDPTATSPLLDQYLETFVPDKEDQDVLFGVLGTILRGGNPGRLLPFFLGGTTSGKSQLLAALDRLLGDYICTINVSVFRGNLDDKPRPDLVRAMYHRIAYAVEASKTWELHSDQVKRITGGDAVPHRDLYGKSVEKVPRFTPLIVTNEMPRIKGADQALKRRLLVVRFDRTLPPEREDASVKERFVRDEGCLRALLARIVAGARHPALRDGVKWTLLPTRYAEAKLASFERLDHISEFVEWLRDREALETVNMTETPLSHCARAGELHDWYNHWLKKHGDKQDKAEALNLRDFGQALRDRGWVSKTSGGVRWVGVKLTSTPGLWS
jgi:P4 family phage/plasmid primase-like protien